ncbi:flagella biosynthesis chaperone FliJ [Vibrio profundum]|uniref:flagellar export protein FliJ n=1 Tax=Vibrio profundum TaxID=2910247 RepID=UPI003D145689
MDHAFEILLKQAKDRENQAAISLNTANLELDDYYKQLAQIEQYRLDYCQQLVQRGMNGLTASQYTHLNRFLTQLDETLAKQKEAEDHFKQQVVSSEDHWQEMRKDRRSYEWLLEKKRIERQRQADRLEQKQMDEFSSQAYARSRRLM